MIKLKLNCREATQITLQAQDRSMPLAERLLLSLHHRTCGNCRRFARQLKLMREAGALWRKYTDE